jgi:uncharacterized damage-inducible protein DinB
MLRVIEPLHEMVRLHDALVRNCVEGVSEEDANEQSAPGTNTMAFLFAHLVNARYYMLGLLGRPAADPLQELLGDVNSVEDATDMPSLDELLRMWAEVGPLLAAALDSASEELLAKESGTPFPVADRTLLGAVAFLIHHESYHLGQMAILRRLLGYEAMSYSRRDTDS